MGKGKKGKQASIVENNDFDEILQSFQALDIAQNPVQDILTQLNKAKTQKQKLQIINLQQEMVIDHFDDLISSANFDEICLWTPHLLETFSEKKLKHHLEHFLACLTMISNPRFIEIGEYFHTNLSPHYSNLLKERNDLSKVKRLPIGTTTILVLLFIQNRLDAFKMILKQLPPEYIRQKHFKLDGAELSLLQCIIFKFAVNPNIAFLEELYQYISPPNPSFCPELSLRKAKKLETDDALVESLAQIQHPLLAIITMMEMRNNYPVKSLIDYFAQYTNAKTILFFLTPLLNDEYISHGIFSPSPVSEVQSCKDQADSKSFLKEIYSDKTISGEKISLIFYPTPNMEKSIEALWETIELLLSQLKEKFSQLSHLEQYEIILDLASEAEKLFNEGKPCAVAVAVTALLGSSQIKTPTTIDLGIRIRLLLLYFQSLAEEENNSRSKAAYDSGSKVFHALPALQQTKLLQLHILTKPENNLSLDQAGFAHCRNLAEFKKYYLLAQGTKNPANTHYKKAFEHLQLLDLDQKALLPPDWITEVENRYTPPLSIGKIWGAGIVSTGNKRQETETSLEELPLAASNNQFG